jgi:hypothetical protein
MRVRIRNWAEKAAFVTGSLALLLLSSANTHAEDARVLPQGRSRFTFIYARSGSVSAQYDPGGNVESITAPYNFELDTSKISSFLGAVAVLQSYLDNLGYYYHVQNSNNPLTVIDKNPANGVLLGDAISRGFLNVNADDVQQQFAVSYNYGVSPSFITA